MELGYIALMDRMHCNYGEFRTAPTTVIEDYLVVMEAEAMVAKVAALEE